MNTILVIGDLIFDRFVYGDVSRISPEAPNLILDQKKEVELLGGAYNVVRHLRSLNNKVHYCSISGDISPYIGNLKALLTLDDFIIWDKARQLTTKTRYISNYKKTTLLRVDEEIKNYFSTEFENQIINKISSLISKVDIICICDYDKGLLSEHFIKKIINISYTNNKKILVDTKRKNIKVFSNIWLIKPNNIELSFIKGHYGNPSMSDQDIAKIINNELNISHLVITKGANGIDLYSNGEFITSSEKYEVIPIELSGAGDVVLSVMCHTLLNKFNLKECVKISNYIASRYISCGPSYNISELNLGNLNISSI